MQSHVTSGKVILGVNHEMRDYATGRKKDLDLVIARPNGGVPAGGPSLKSLATQYRINLTPQEQTLLAGLPDIPVAPVGATLVALEAKATMTAHVKSLPRLYDELNSSHLCVHGSSVQALAIAYVQVNHSATFVSPIINSKDMARGLPPEITKHKQPADTQRVLDKVAEIPRRSNSKGTGFDAIGVTVLDLVNDGSPVRLVNSPPAPQQGDNFHYGSMIVRMANEYDATFAHI
ncbi:hypothetical protein [Nocardioides sp. L-11A]|uniref:hypothetical protein n=1 Tax=Nocardioides sp. L-11A TaxID=3043848 RepID=UPI00249B8317|nr:hypothetical protein QJ852_09360 [Nocardioides sp. L-11A]